MQINIQIANLSAGTLDFKSIRLTCFPAGVINISPPCDLWDLSRSICNNVPLVSISAIRYLKEVKLKLHFIH